MQHISDKPDAVLQYKLYDPNAARLSVRLCSDFPVYVSLICIIRPSMCYVFWLFWLSAVSSDWLEKETQPWRGDPLHKAQAEECL